MNLSRFNRSFWTANVSELFERIAFYGMTPMLVLYLTEARNVPDETAIRIGGNFGLVTYGLAALSGFLADIMGYRRSMILAYGLLAAGYFLTGQMTSTPSILATLLMVAVGASLIKPIITGTVQKTCSDRDRAVGFSVYYMLVNIGGFLGPNISGFVRQHHGVEAVFVSCGTAALIALGMALFLYREPESTGTEERRKLGQLGGDLLKVAKDWKLLLLFLFVAGFWSMFFQFFNVLPLYLRDVVKASPQMLGLIPSLGAGTIIFGQVLVGWLVRDMNPFRAILLGIILSSVGVASMGLWPSVLLAGLGVVVFSLGEMVYSAHFYHHLGNIAPPGQTGMYLGFAFLPIAVGSFLSGQIGAPVATYFRETLQRPQAMWFAFAAVGFASAAGLALLTWGTRGRHEAR